MAEIEFNDYEMTATLLSPKRQMTMSNWFEEFDRPLFDTWKHFRTCAFIFDDISLEDFGVLAYHCSNIPSSWASNDPDDFVRGGPSSDNVFPSIDVAERDRFDMWCIRFGDDITLAREFASQFMEISVHLFDKIDFFKFCELAYVYTDTRDFDPEPETHDGINTDDEEEFYDFLPELDL